jgi:hypothetical protein
MRSWDGDLWVHPLPPDGPVTFVASWPRYGITEIRADLDGTAIREAARQAVVLWPEDPDPGPAGSWRVSQITAHRPAEPGQATAGS